MDNPEDCSVCFTKYDESERRPRNLPCGHNFCSLCLQDLLRAGQVSCPTCRVAHQATNISSFPIAYGTEALIKKMEALKQQQISTPPSISITDTASSGNNSTVSAATGVNSKKQKTGLNRKLQSVLEEQINSVEGLLTGYQQYRSQLDQYSNELDSSKDEHLQLLDKLFILVEQHKAAVQQLQQEETRVVAMKKEGEEGKQQLKAALKFLKDVNTAQEAGTAIDHADYCSVEVEDWRLKGSIQFPDKDILTTSLKIRDNTRRALETMPAQEDGATKDTDTQEDGATKDTDTQDSATKDTDTQDGATKDTDTHEDGATKDTDTHEDGATKDTDAQDGATKDTDTSHNISTVLQDPTLSIMDKVWKITKQVLKDKTVLRSLIKGEALYGVQQDQGHCRCSKMSLHKSQVYFHCLRDEPPPSHVRTLPVSEVLGLMAPSSILTFMDLAWGGSTRGRVHIRLRSDNTLATQFMLLCTGQRGHSYRNTVLLEVGNKGMPTEVVRGGDYQYNNGDGGAPLLTHYGTVDDYPKSPKAGTVALLYDRKYKEKSSKFYITTKDRDDNKVWLRVFGDVASGLEVVKAAVNHSNIRDVTVVDCGVVLSL